MMNTASLAALDITSTVDDVANYVGEEMKKMWNDNAAMRATRQIYDFDACMRSRWRIKARSVS